MGMVRWSKRCGLLSRFARPTIHPRCQQHKRRAYACTCIVLNKIRDATRRVGGLSVHMFVIVGSNNNCGINNYELMGTSGREGRVHTFHMYVHLYTQLNTQDDQNYAGVHICVYFYMYGHYMRIPMCIHIEDLCIWLSIHMHIYICIYRYIYIYIHTNVCIYL